MIQIYKPTNTNYDSNGDIILLPTKCEVTAGINRTWHLEIEHPIDEEGRWAALIVNAVLKVPSFNGPQLFRITEVSKNDSGVVAGADPIFYDAVYETYIADVRPTNKTAQQAIDMLCAGTRFTGSSDITDKKTTYIEKKNLVEGLTGAGASVLGVWGGEVAFDNYNIIINQKLGGDYGVGVLYGKNLAVDGVTEDVNMDEVVTRIIPEAYNGIQLPGNTPWVDSPIINAYPIPRVKIVEYSNIRLRADETGEDAEATYYDTLEEVYAALRTAAAEEFSVNDIDKPTVNLTVDMVLLENTAEYKDYKSLEKVSLGDYITCKSARLGIESKARVINLVYDCGRESVISVEIGRELRRYFDDISTTIQAVQKAVTPTGSVRAQQIEGIIDGAYAQLRLQNTIAKKQDVRAILFEDLDPNSPTFGALSIGTQGWQISRERTQDGRDWVWTTAATSAGIIANTVVSGLLTDKEGKNYWNLDTGEFSLASTTTVGGQTVQTIANNAASAAVNAQTQQQIFNKLTNNGAAKGIYLNNGELYINGTYIKSGVIDADLITTGTLSAIDINGVNITGSTITGNTISGGTVSGTAISGGTISGTNITGGTITGNVFKSANKTSATDNNAGVYINAGTTPSLGIGAKNGNHLIYNSDGVEIKTGGLEIDTGGNIATIGSINAGNFNSDYYYLTRYLISDQGLPDDYELTISQKSIDFNAGFKFNLQNAASTRFVNFRASTRNSNGPLELGPVDTIGTAPSPFVVNWSGNTSVLGLNANRGWLVLKSETGGNAFQSIYFRDAAEERASGTYIRTYDKDENGAVMLIRPGASLIAGGGEFASNFYNLDTTLNDEATYIGADSVVKIISNGNTIANRKEWTFNTAGNLIIPTGGLIAGVDLPALNTTVGNVSTVANNAKAKTDKLSFAAGINTSYIGDGTNTTATYFWGNATNRVAIGATNSSDNKRYNFAARDSFLRMERVDGSTSTVLYDVYPSQFLAGESFTIPPGPYNGYVTSSGTAIHFHIPTPRDASGATVKLSAKVAAIIRGTAGYVDDSYNTTTVGSTSAYTWTVAGVANGIRVTITKSSALSNVTNNTPISLQFRSNVTFNFS